jgi:adenosine deaminase
MRVVFSGTMNRSDTRTVDRKDLRRLPKAHLHVHLEAVPRATTARDLLAAAGLPDLELPYRGGFAGFAAAYTALAAVLADPAAMRRVIGEAAEDAFNEGVVALELAVSPQFAVDAGHTVEEVLAVMTEAALDSSRDTGVSVGLMVTVDRTRSPEEAECLVRAAVAHAGRGVVSLGLANDEVGHPATPFARAFALGRDAGLRVAPHAGELVGPDAVREAIDVLGADRVQHGVRAGEDPVLVERLAREGVQLDVCPTSNVALGVVSTLSVHPLRALLGAGVPCSINADDPLLFGTTVLGEYELARRDLGLSDDELATCARTSVRAASMPDALRGAALDAIDAWVRA